MIELTQNPIDTAALLEQVSSTRGGAVLLFLGTARDMSDGRSTESLDYECYRAMAEKKLAELEAEARSRWPIIQCAVSHRLGHLELGDVSVAVAVCTAHRQTAFEAGRWLIDTLKQVVPIWKKENWTDGESTWVHPGRTYGP